MRKLLSSAVERQIVHGVALLSQGGVIALPTDTVYGIAAHAFDEGAIERVFTIKGRPQGMPIPLLLADASQLPLVAQEVSALAWRLVERFWPGAVTLVVPRKPNVPAILAARGWTIGVRVPDHPVPRELALRLGAPVTGTSANRSGKHAASTAEEVHRELGSMVDLVIKGGPSPAGRESTVVDVTGAKPKILRVGAISKEMIEEACGLLDVEVQTRESHHGGP